MAKTTLVTGVTGQDGAYPSEFLLANDFPDSSSFAAGVGRLKGRGSAAKTPLQEGLVQSYIDHIDGLRAA